MAYGITERQNIVTSHNPAYDLMQMLVKLFFKVILYYNIICICRKAKKATGDLNGEELEYDYV